MTNGIINVYKEKGFTSFDVVAKLRGIFHQKKIGHTGTLDPDAEGVLPICLGNATKVCDLLQDKDKEYEAVLLLGFRTDTQDMTGTVLEESEVAVTEKEVETVIASFVGKIMQIPPMYSALKVNGKKLCDLAREGIEVERKAREIEIFSIQISKMELPRIHMTVHCSKGTYIRTLCNDIGEKLGCHGAMEDLKRTRVSSFKIEDAHTLKEIAEQFDESYLFSTDSVFLQYEKCVVSNDYRKAIDNGNVLDINAVLCGEKCTFENDVWYRCYREDGRFIGIYRYLETERLLKPVKLFFE